MVDINQELEKIEVYKEDLDFSIERAEKLKRLYDIDDFKELIIEDLFKDEAARCVALLHSDTCRQNQSLADKINMKIVMIGELQNWFIGIGSAAQQAKATYEDVSKYEEEEEIK